MATSTILPLPRAVFYGPNSQALAGGFVFTYLPNTSTPATTWQDPTQSTPNANPIPLDANGSCLLYGAGDYSILVTDSLGNQVRAYSGLTQDVVAAVAAAGAAAIGALPLTGGTLTGPLNINTGGVGLNVTGSAVIGADLTVGGTVSAGAVATFSLGVGGAGIEFADGSVQHSAASSTVGATASGLKIQVTSTSALTLVAPAVALANATSSGIVAQALSVTISTGTVGVNGLDAGTVSASSTYLVYAIGAPGAVGTGSITGSVLNIIGGNSGVFAVGQTISGVGIPLGIRISSLGTGTGQTGTYNLSGSATVPTITIFATGVAAAGLLSLSFFPTLPTGYTFFARVGAVITNGSAQLITTLQLGKRAQYVGGAALPEIIAGASGSTTTPTWTATNVTTGAQPIVPFTAAAIYLVLFNQTATESAMAAPNNSYLAFSSAVSPPPLVANTSSSISNSVQTGSFLLESVNVYYASSGGSTGLLCLGWEDNL